MSEPNEKMIELLKRYVAQRKAESSADFELHPATRNLLQGEVAQRFRKTEGAEKKKSLLVLLWPRLAIAGAFRDRAFPVTQAAVGEISLAGEIRPVSSAKQRTAEARRLGFSTVIDSDAVHVREALRLAFAGAHEERVDVPDF